MDQAQEFSGIFERLNDELFRHAQLRLSDRERAVELTQEAFLRTWEYIRRGENVEEYRPFLYRVLNNLIIDEYRRRRTQSLDALLENDETHDAVEGALLSDDIEPLEEALVRFEGQRALAALAQLSHSHREVLVLRYVDGFTIPEIADMTGDSRNAISVRIHRALQKLRGALEKNEQGKT